MTFAGHRPGPSGWDDIDPEVVAAIVAALTTPARPKTDDEADNWAASGRVAPDWREHANGVWRDRDRTRGWRA